MNTNCAGGCAGTLMTGAISPIRTSAGGAGGNTGPAGGGNPAILALSALCAANSPRRTANSSLCNRACCCLSAICCTSLLPCNSLCKAILSLSTSGSTPPTERGSPTILGSSSGLSRLSPSLNLFCSLIPLATSLLKFFFRLAFRFFFFCSFFNVSDTGTRPANFCACINLILSISCGSNLAPRCSRNCCKRRLSPSLLTSGLKLII